MLQDILEESISQVYPLGMPCVRDDRRFHYGRADTARIVRPAYGAYPNITYAETGVVAATAAIRTKVVSLTEVGTVALNEFRDGYMFCQVAGWGQQYKIRSNTEAVAGVFTVTLYDALVQALTINEDIVTLFHSPWRDIHCMRQEMIDGVNTNWRKVSFTCIPTRQFTAGYYGWFQVAGPCPFALSAGSEGVADSERLMVFDDYGALMRFDFTNYPRNQLAGYILPVMTAGAFPQAMGQIWLMLGQ